MMMCPLENIQGLQEYVHFHLKIIIFEDSMSINEKWCLILLNVYLGQVEIFKFTPW